MRFVPHASAVAVGISNDQLEPHSTVLLAAHVMLGGVVSATVMIWLQMLVLLQASITAHARTALNVLPQRAFVKVPRITVRFVPHASGSAVGESNIQAEPHSTVRLVGQMRSGIVVSTIVTVWLQVFVLLQPSIAAHVRVAEKVAPHKALVTVPRTTIRLVLHVFVDVMGSSKLHGVPHSTVLFVAHVIKGVEMPTTVIVWLHVLLLLQASITAQVRVATKLLPQGALVTVATMTIRLVPQASAGAVGTSNDQVEPHCTVLLVPQVIVGGAVSTMVTV